MNARSMRSKTLPCTQSCEGSFTVAFFVIELYGRIVRDPFYGLLSYVPARFFGFSSSAPLKSKVKHLHNLNTKWWWHELALVNEIGLEGTETLTARELLAPVIAPRSHRRRRCRGYFPTVFCL